MLRSLPRCPGCGYSLLGLGAGPCPECGRPFDPAIPSTLARDSPLAALAPHRSINIGYALFIIPVTLLICSPQGELSDDWSGWRMLVVAATTIVWGVPFLMHCGARIHVCLKRFPQPAWRWSWLVVPAVLMSCLAFQSSGILFRARWSCSRAAFNAYLSTPTNPPPKRLGAFHIIGVQVFPDGSTRFDVGFPDLYSQGPPEIIHQPVGYPTPSIFTTDLGGGWWMSTNPT